MCTEMAAASLTGTVHYPIFLHSSHPILFAVAAAVELLGTRYDSVQVLLCLSHEENCHHCNDAVARLQ